MSDFTADDGTIQVLLERLNTLRLPRALAMKKRVDAGELLQESDIEFLTRALEDARNAGTLVHRHPEFKELAEQVSELYAHITRVGLENQRKQGA